MSTVPLPTLGSAGESAETLVHDALRFRESQRLHQLQHREPPHEQERHSSISVQALSGDRSLSDTERPPPRRKASLTATSAIVTSAIDSHLLLGGGGSTVAPETTTDDELSASENVPTSSSHTPSHLIPPSMSDIRPYSHLSGLLLSNGMALVVVFPAAVIMYLQHLLLSLFTSPALGGGQVIGFSLLARFNQEVTAALLRWSRSYMRDRFVHLPTELTLTLLIAYYFFGFEPRLIEMVGISTFSYWIGLVMVEISRRRSWVTEFRFDHNLSDDEEMPQYLVDELATLTLKSNRSVLKVLIARVGAVFAYWTAFWIITSVQVVPVLVMKEQNSASWIQVLYSGFLLPIFIWGARTFLLSWFWKQVIVPDSRQGKTSAFTVYRKWVAVICTALNFTSFVVLFQFASVYGAVTSALIQLCTELAGKFYTISTTLRNVRRALKGARSSEFASATREVGVNQVLETAKQGRMLEDDEDVMNSIRFALASRHVGETLAEKSIILLAPLACHLFIEDSLSLNDLFKVGLIYFGFEVVTDACLGLLLEKFFALPMRYIQLSAVLSRDDLTDILIQAFAVNIIVGGTMAAFVKGRLV